MKDSMTTTNKNSILKNMLLSWAFPRGHRRGTKSSATGTTTTSVLPKSKSCHYPTSTTKTSKTKTQVIPHGCFSVYVGQEKQKFVIKTECANHPLFKMLLEDAELEYGFNSEGPILIPCDVDLFYKVLAEMDGGKEMDSAGCGFAYGSCSPFNPTRRLGRNNDMIKVYGSYEALTPSRLLKLNRF